MTTSLFKYVRQNPGMYRIVGALFEVPVGEIWPINKFLAVKTEVKSAALHL